jgi:hypothetical protein
MQRGALPHASRAEDRADLNEGFDVVCGVEEWEASR